MLTRSTISNLMRLFVTSDSDYLEMVWAVGEFNKTFEVQPRPDMQANLIVEETIEWVEELHQYGVTENLLKETIDILYVMEGLLAMNTEEFLDIDSDTRVKLTEAVSILTDFVYPVVRCIYTPKEILNAFLEVQRSNMSKLTEEGDVLRREDGKILKSDQYSPADLTGLYDAENALNDMLLILKGED